MPLDLRRILQATRTIAVVGWSANEDRAANDVAAYLHGQGYRVLPVNPVYAGDAALGHTVVPRLQDLDGEDVDVILVFRKSEDVPPVADDALALWGEETHMRPRRPPVGRPGRGGPVGQEEETPRRVFWMQLGIWNDVVRERMEAAGFDVVENLCFKVEHARASGRGW